MIRLAACIALALLATAAAARADEHWKGKALRGCESEDGFPPFTFQGADQRARGYSVDLASEIIAGTGLRLEVSFMPTKRCNAAIDAGAIDLDMEDVWTPDYSARWLPSASMWDATDAIYYDKTRFPNGISVADLRANPGTYPGCGLFGDPYDEFPAGQIDTSAYRFEDAFNRLLQGRCAFVPELLEFAESYKFKDLPLLSNSRIGYTVLPMIPTAERPEKYGKDGRYPIYFYLRKDFPESRALMERFNDTIARWRASGRDREVMSRYIDLSLLSHD